MSDNIVTSPDGYQWFVGGAETDDHLALGGHEFTLAPIMRDMCVADKGYVNVGAHVGLWAIRLAKNSRYVIAFEANPLTAVSLQRNVQLNNLEDKIKVVPRAVWNADNEKVVMVDVNEKLTGGSTRAETHLDMERTYAGAPISRTITLDTFFDGMYETVGFISMDVEGAEAKVLEGARKLLATGKPNILIELHEGHPGTDSDLREQVYGILDSLGYSYTSIKVAPPGEHLMCYPDTAHQLDEYLPS